MANNYNPKNCNHIINKNPEIVDLILLIPKKYYYILDKNFNLNHNSWSYYKAKYKLNDSDMGFMSDMKFDSNTYIDKNPFYVMSSRDENTELHTNTNSKICPKYIETEQQYLEIPTKYYLTNNEKFYKS